MIAAVLFLCASAGLAGPVESVKSVKSVESVEASAALEPAAGSAWDGGALPIGQPLLFTVTLVGDGAAGASPAKADLGLDFAWALVDGPRDVAGEAPTSAGRPAYRQQWTLIPLEAGEISTPPVKFKLASGESVTVPPATIEVATELGDEDQPRPMRGFREVEDRRLGDPRLVLAAAGTLLLLPLLAMGFVRFRRRPRGDAAAQPQLDAHQAIDALDAAGDPRAAMSALGPLLRRALDEVLGRDGAPETDGEWAAAIAASNDLAAEDRRAAGALIEELSAVRFGGGDPTSFAAKDAVKRARDLLSRSATAQEGGP